MNPNCAALKFYKATVQSTKFVVANDGDINEEDDIGRDIALLMDTERLSQECSLSMVAKMVAKMVCFSSDNWDF